jgi:hypothetical protein
VAGKFAGEYLRRGVEGDADKSMDDHPQGSGDDGSSVAVDCKISPNDYDDVQFDASEEVEECSDGKGMGSEDATVADTLEKERLLELMIRERLRALRAKKDHHLPSMILAKSHIHFIRSAESTDVAELNISQQLDDGGRQRAIQNETGDHYELFNRFGPEKDHLESSYMLSRNPLRKTFRNHHHPAAASIRDANVNTSTPEATFSRSQQLPNHPDPNSYSTELCVDGWSFKSSEVE